MSSSGRLAITIGYIGMGFFFSVPLYKMWIGQPYNFVGVSVLLGIAIGFGMFATYELGQYQKDKEEQKKKNTYDNIIETPCPKCGNELVELTSPIDAFVLNSYKGLIYCKSCDFEESKDKFERENPDYE